MTAWADETYDKKWAVKDEGTGLDFGQDEVAKNNVIEGSYHVLLPDGRIQTVTYHVDKDSGYTASVTYEQGPAPELHHSYGTPASPLYETPAPSPPHFLYDNPEHTSEESQPAPVLDLRSGNYH